MQRQDVCDASREIEEVIGVDVVRRSHARTNDETERRAASAPV